MDFPVLKRAAQAALLDDLRIHRVVSVVGCRQSGKSTLVRGICRQPEAYLTLDADDVREAAKRDPRFFVRSAPTSPMVIDEIQKVPGLIGEIKRVVDESPKKGQFIITGSADYRKLPQANESLAGRVGFVRVRTFTEAELRGTGGGLLAALFEKKLPLSCPVSECNKPLIFTLAAKGGFFEPQTFDATQRAKWFSAYLEQQVLLDMREQWLVRKKALAENLLASLAAFSGKLLSVRAIGRQLDANLLTLQSYLSAIEAMYLVDRVPGWSQRDFDRPGQTPKIFMTDSGLMAHLLGLREVKETRLHDPAFSSNIVGKLVGTWAYNQIVTEVEQHFGWTLHHLRTKAHEIDFLVTDEAGRMLAIDIKAGESVSGDDFRHIRWFQKMMGDVPCLGVVLYAGNNVLSFGSDCCAVPMANFWRNF